MFQVLAMSTGKKLVPVADDEARRTRLDYDKCKAEYLSREHFDALKRILVREEPDFAD